MGIWLISPVSWTHGQYGFGDLNVLKENFSLSPFRGLGVLQFIIRERGW